MDVSIVSVSIASTLAPGDDIYPAVSVRNTGTTAVSVGVAWNDDDLTDFSEHASDSFTMLGTGAHASETLYPPMIKQMPASGNFSGVLNLLKINDDGITWSKSGISKTISITNSGGTAAPPPVPPTCPSGQYWNGTECVDEEQQQSFWQKYKKWIIGGVGVLAILAVAGGAMYMMKGKKQQPPYYPY